MARTTRATKARNLIWREDYGRWITLCAYCTRPARASFITRDDAVSWSMKNLTCLECGAKHKRHPAIS